MVILAFLGCSDPKQLPMPSPLTRFEAIEHYNNNVKSIPPYRAQISKWQVQFTQNDKTEVHQDILGKIIYQPDSPGQHESFYLQADAAAGFGSKALVLGADKDEFWFFSKPASSGWIGRFEHLNKPCMKEFVFQPNDIFDLLGLKLLRQNLDGQMLWSYKVAQESYSLMQLTVDMGEDLAHLKREILFDRRTQRVSEVIYYDSQGHRIMHGHLSNYQKVTEQCYLPGDVMVEYVIDGSFLKLSLRNFKPYKKDLSPLLNISRKMKSIDNIYQLDDLCEKE